MPEGIRKRHSKGCGAREGGRCSCNAGYEAWVFSRRDQKKIRKTFKREAEARSWRSDALAALSKGGLRAPKRTTVQQAWDGWYEGAKAGTVTNRSGHPYKPSALRSYEQAMRLRVLPTFGEERLIDLRRPDLQEFVNRLVTEKKNPSTIQITLLPLRAIFRRALSLGEVAVNPLQRPRAPRRQGPQRALCDTGRGRGPDRCCAGR